VNGNQFFSRYHAENQFALFYFQMLEDFSAAPFIAATQDFSTVFSAAGETLAQLIMRG